MRSREDFHSMLLKYCDNVYFTPSSNTRMKYPCIIYSRSKVIRRFSDNEPYINYTLYDVTVVTEDPDSVIYNGILENIPYSSYENTIVNDNLFHFHLNIFY